VEADQAHDLRIFALALLSSSMLVYNSTGCIDGSAVDLLAASTQFAREMSATSPDAGEVFADRFVWCVRDFTLELKVPRRRSPADADSGSGRATTRRPSRRTSTWSAPSTPARAAPPAAGTRRSGTFSPPGSA
jgi:hypothetical protein